MELFLDFKTENIQLYKIEQAFEVLLLKSKDETL